MRATPINAEQAPPAMPAKITIRQLEQPELVAASHDPELKLQPAYVEKGRQWGYIAFGAFDGDRLVAYTWRTTSVAGVQSGVQMRVPKPYSYIAWAFCRPDYRGNRLIPNLVLRTDPFFARMGYTHRLAIIDVCNLASIRAAKSFGSRFVGLAVIVHWFNRTWFLHTPQVRRRGLGFARQAIDSDELIEARLTR